MTFDIQLLLTIAGIAALVAAIIQVIKSPLKLDDAGRQAWLPLIAVALGIFTGVVAGLILINPWTAQVIAQQALNGFFGGLTAIGLHQGVKSLGLTSGVVKSD